MDSLTNKEKITSALSKNDIKSQLEHIGLSDFMCVEVHSYLSEIGYVIGGANTINDALKEVLVNGTIVMPSFNEENSEPLYWKNPEVDLRLIEKIRTNTPGYDIYSSDLSSMGEIVMNLRNRKDTFHSYHPNKAFMATGKDSRELMSNQPLNFPLGKASVLEKLYYLKDSYVLLIGVNYNQATVFHLAEEFSGVRSVFLQGGAVKKNGESIWKKYLDIESNKEEYLEIGKQMEKNKLVKVGKLGAATCKLFKFKDAVDFASDYLIKKYRGEK